MHACLGDDFKCDDTLVCYSHTTLSWVNTGSDFCDCSSWYGWRKDQNGLCRKLGVQSYLSLGISSVILLIALVSFLNGTFSLWRIVKLQKRENLRNASTVTAIFATIALLLYMVWVSCEIVTILTPALNSYYHQNDPTTKFHVLTKYNRGLSAASFFFTTLTLLNLPVMWIQISSMCQLGQRDVLQNAIVYKRIVFGTQIVFSLTMGLLTAVGECGVAFLVSMPFLAGIMVMYIVGNNKMKRLLTGIPITEPDRQKVESKGVSFRKDSIGRQNSSWSTATANTKTKYRLMIGLIRTTAYLEVAIIMLSLIVGGLFTYFTYGVHWREVVLFDGLSASAVTCQLICFLGCSAVCVVYWYISTSMKTSLQRLAMRSSEEAGNEVLSGDEVSDDDSDGVLALEETDLALEGTEDEGVV